MAIAHCIADDDGDEAIGTTIDAGRPHAAAGRYARVDQRIAATYAKEGSRPTVLLEAQIALVATPQIDPDSVALKAHAAELQTWVALHADDSLAWGALGQTWARLGAPLRSLRAEAESRYALGDLLGAVDRLRAGQRVARSGGNVDFIDASVIDSRLRAIEAQRKQIEVDQRASR